MESVKVYNQQGEETGEKKLNPAIFNLKVKPELIQQVVVAQQLNRRQVLAHAKDRSEVRGGGRKPWRQKGTGRARHGSIRSPLWRGGGATFGPLKTVNFNLKVNKKVKKKAILMSLSDKAINQKIILIDKLELPEIKTKKFYTILQNLKLRPKKEKKVKKDTETKDKKSKKSEKSKISKVKEKSILMIMDKKDDKIFRSAKNITRVSTINVNSLNVVDILKHQYLIMPVAALKKIEDLFLKNK